MYLLKPPLYGPDFPRPATAPVDLGGRDRPPVPTSWYHDRRPQPDPRATSTVPQSGQFAPAAGERPAFVPMPPGPVSYLGNSIDVAFTLFTDCSPSAAIRHADGDTEGLSSVLILIDSLIIR